MPRPPAAATTSPRSPGFLPDTEALIMRGGTAARALAAMRAEIADASPGDPLLVMTTVPTAVKASMHNAQYSKRRAAYRRAPR